jgi:cytochrome P450
MEILSRQTANANAAEEVCPYTGATVSSQLAAATTGRKAALKEPPGDMGRPYIGNMKAFGADPFSFTLNGTRKYGGVWKTRLLGTTVVFFAGARPFSFFMDPNNFTRENATVKFVQALLHPEAVPFLDGDVHKRRKQLLLAAFSDAALEGYLPNIQAVFNRYAAGWVGQDKAIGRDVRQLVFDIINVLFAAGDPTKTNVALADDFTALAQGAFAVPVNLPGTTYRKALQARDRLRAFVKKQVTENDGAGTALGVLKQARLPNGERLSAHEIEIELVHFFFAAVAALGSALAWSLVVLGQNPELAARLRAEADGVFGANAEPTFAQVKRLSLAAQVSRETLRTSPLTTTTLVGMAKRDLEFDGMIIRKGWKAIGLTWATLQDGTTFKDPSRFDPDRLSEEAMRSLPEGAYVPMSGGPRDGHRCGGEELVKVVIPTFIAWFVRNHDWTFPPQDTSPGPGGLGPLPRGGLRMQIRKRAR